MNVLPVSRQRAVVAATLGVVGLLSASPAMAASATWSATPVDANWITAANWSTNAVPGIVNPNGATQIATDGQDVVTFNTATTGGIGGPGNPIVIDAQRTVKSFVFDSGAGAYHFAGGPLWLSATSPLDLAAGTNQPGSGSITLNSGVTTAQTFAAPIAFRLSSSTNGAYALVNNAASPAATLNFANLANNSAATRPLTLTLDGSNTGFNRIDSLVDSGAVNLIKNGAGTWVLTGANTILQQTSAGVVAGATVNAGTLAVQNSGSLGALTAANIRATGTGTLRVDNVTLNNAGVTLDQTGTIQGTGTAGLNSLIVAATATDVNLSTVGSGDVFTVGSAAAATGGSASTNLHITGPGTIALASASTFAGSVSVDAGKLLVSNATALGAAATANLTFAPASTGVVQLNGVSVTVNGLQGTAATSAVEAASGTNTLTVANVAANQYGGSIRDGAGQIALVKNAGGLLALTGNSTYTGGTTINAGTLLANSTSGSATGTGPVTVSSNTTLGGSGTAGGLVTVNGNARIAPGAAAGQIGTLTVGSLSLASGSQLDFDVNTPANADRIVVSQSGGLTVDGGTLNFNGGATPFTTNGVYNLIGYAGSINGIGLSALALNANNQNAATNSYAFGTAGGYVTLTVASTGSTVSYWNADADGNWSTGPWTPTQPNSVGAFASFGGGGTAITANRTITVDSNKTVGTIAFNQPNGFSYTLAGPGTITLDNGPGQSFISSTAGSHTINAPIALTANGVNAGVAGAANTLAINGVVGGNGGVNKTGLGTLALSGNNTYTGGTVVTAGNILVNSANSLGAISGVATFAGGTLQLANDVTTIRTYVTDGNGSDIRIDTNGHTLTYTGTLAAGNGAAGGLTKLGSGTLALSTASTYTGATTISGGTVRIAANNNLGTPASGGGLNLSNGGTLATAATLALNNGAAATNARAITLGTGGGGLAPASGTFLTVSGPISGTGRLTVADAGQVTILTPTAGQNSFTGGTLLSGTLLLGEMNAVANALVANSTVTFNGGTLSERYYNSIPSTGTGNTYNLVVPAGATGTLRTGARVDHNGSLTGSGTLNVQTDYIRSNFAGNWSAFAGQINISAGPNGGDFRVNNGNGYVGSKINLAAGANVYGIVNFAAAGATYSIGELSGVSGSFLGGGPTAGRTLTWSIGALNTNSQFDGVVRNGTGPLALTKVGTGTLTLTGANGYSGLTTLNAGTLAINGQFALGGAVYAGTTFNGGTLAYTANLPGTNGTADVTADSTGVAKPVTLLAGGGTVNTNGNAVAFANPITGTGGFTKAGAGTLTFNAANTYAGSTVVTGGTLVSGTTNTAALLANANGINVANGQIVLNYDSGNSPVAAIRALLAASYQAATTPGVMETGQIRSSTATAARGLGYKDDGTGVTIKATLFGDADLDGGVSINDFNALAGNFGQASGKVWTDGDFDYDGGVSINDFNLLAGGFGQSIPASSEMWAGLLAFAKANNDLVAFEAVTGVPEPTGLGLIAAGATLALRRRRRA